MKLQTALLLSSKKQAITAIRHTGLIFSLFPRYRLTVTQGKKLLAPMDTPIFTVSIFVVTYPDKAPGKGWGKPVVAAHPHVEQSFEQLEELQQFLEQHELAGQDGWDSVEEDPPKSVQLVCHA